MQFNHKDRSLSTVSVVDFLFFIIFQYPIAHWLQWFWCSLAIHEPLYESCCNDSMVRLNKADVELSLWFDTAWATPMAWMLAGIAFFKVLHAFLTSTKTRS
jgi:hypothetical protein